MPNAGTGTERDAGGSKLHGLAKAHPGRLEVETVDIVHPDQVAALHARLASRTFDMLFVNAGITNDHRETVADVSTEEFVRVMVTNALSPIRVIERLRDVVAPHGTIGIVSSGQAASPTTRMAFTTCTAAARRRSTCTCATSPPATPATEERCC